MSYIKNIMMEEHQRLQALSKKYSDIIASFPRGAASIKKRNNHDYLYLASRKDGKVTFNYIGPVASEKTREILEQVNARKQYELKLKQVNQDLKEIERVVHGRKI